MLAVINGEEFLSILFSPPDSLLKKKKKLYFYCMEMCVFLRVYTCICGCLWRLEENIGSPGVGVTCELLDMGAET